MVRTHVFILTFVPPSLEDLLKYFGIIQLFAFFLIDVIHSEATKGGIRTYYLNDVVFTYWPLCLFNCSSNKNGANERLLAAIFDIFHVFTKGGIWAHAVTIVPAIEGIFLREIQMVFHAFQRVISFDTLMMIYFQTLFGTVWRIGVEANRLEVKKNWIVLEKCHSVT